MNKIELEYPYKNDWSCGYLVNDRDGRCKLILYNCSTDRSTTLYARYKLAVKIGRYLTENETVDHIDEDRTNDDLSNLQILSREQNNKKHSIHSGGKTMVKITCPVCGIRFIRERRQTHLVKDKIYDYCSRACTGLSRRKGVIYEMNPEVFKEFE